VHRTVRDDHTGIERAAGAARRSGAGPSLAEPSAMARLGRRVIAGARAAAAMHQVEAARLAATPGAEGAR